MLLICNPAHAVQFTEPQRARLQVIYDQASICAEPWSCVSSAGPGPLKITMLHVICVQLRAAAPGLKVAAWNAAAKFQVSLNPCQPFPAFSVLACCPGSDLSLHAVDVLLNRPDLVCTCWQAAGALHKVPAKYHISVSRTVALRYAQVDEVISSLRHRLRKTSK